MCWTHIGVFLYYMPRINVMQASVFCVLCKTTEWISVFKLLSVIAFAISVSE